MSLEKPDFNGAKEYVFQSLESMLPANLYYHNFDHTKEVLEGTTHISGIEGITKEDMLLVKTAALFHDIGFIYNYHDNEKIAVQEIRKVLPLYFYSEPKIERTGEIIMATKMKYNGESFVQMAGNDLLQKILCDGDLLYLGTDKFFETSENLRRERESQGQGPISEEEWAKGNLLFLKNHKYLTKAGKLLGDEGKEKNMHILEERLNASRHNFF
ncbi:MAG: HD domain-containing protein [archaeon]|nr:HD domain-containing protein [archaeon]